MSTDPTSGSPSEFAAVGTEKAWYIGQYISAVFLGAQISLVIQSTYYLTHGPYTRPKKIFFILYGFLLVVLVAIADSTNEIEGFLMWIPNRDIPGGPEAYMVTQLSGWVNAFGTSAIVTANFMGDALLLYRCYVLLANNKLLIVIPALLLTASTTLAVFTVIESALPNASIFHGRAQSLGVPWVAITIAFNIVVTSLICGRIFFTYLSLKRLGITSGTVTDRSWGIIAILIESALPFSVFGVIFAVFYATANPFANAFADIWGNILGLSPQLIILRVAMGHAWTKNSVSVVQAMDGLDDRMQFQARKRGTSSTTEVWSDNSGTI